MSSFIGLHEIVAIVGEEDFTLMIEAGFTLDDVMQTAIQGATGERRRHLANLFYYRSDMDELLISLSCGFEDIKSLLSFIGHYKTNIECEACSRMIEVKTREEYYNLMAREVNLYTNQPNDEPILCRMCHPFLGRNLARWSGYVYLLKSNGVFKIGKSINVDRRLTQISPIMPYPVELVHAIRTTNHTALEAQLHEMFDAKRLNGEWFELSARDIRLIQSLQDVEI